MQRKLKFCKMFKYWKKLEYCKMLKYWELLCCEKLKFLKMTKCQNSVERKKVKVLGNVKVVDAI